MAKAPRSSSHRRPDAKVENLKLGPGSKDDEALLLATLLLVKLFHE